MAEECHCGGRARFYTGADRWIVSPDESRTAFMVLATNSDQSWIGGDAECYPAHMVAASIERWSTERAGLNGCREFVDALERDMLRAEAKGTRLEIIRTKYLLDAMRARVVVAQAEDAQPFTGCGHHRPADVDDSETATLIIPWEAGHDG
jgi:hypothetical protein